MSPEGADKDEQVQALPLGQEAYERDAADLAKHTLPESATCGTLASTACKEFEATKHTVRNGFLEFWNEHDGERLIGAPLTEEFLASDGYTTQYFEKMVLRWKEGLGGDARAQSAASLPARRNSQPRRSLSPTLCRSTRRCSSSSPRSIRRR